MEDDFATRVEGISALAEPARRALYQYVAEQPDAVSREQAAVGVGLPQHTAKFHLDKLVDEGLLDAEYRRLSGRQGPGAGRPAKLYRRSSRQLEVSLPERQYRLAGEIMASAIEVASTTGTPVATAVAAAAREKGRRLGLEARTDELTRVEDPGISEATEVLASHGYEPRVQDDRVVLVNCPFHALSQQHKSLVCGMNVELISALMDQLGRHDADVRLDPAEGRCCVTFAAPSHRS
jgi:predicted ArsR family transcriptional regulator